MFVENDAEGQPQRVYMTESEWDQVKGWSNATHGEAWEVPLWDGLPVMVVPDETLLGAQMELSGRWDGLWAAVLQEGKESPVFRWLCRLLRRS